tara:strand:+ start:132 stop:482 length:351 start_codon:yes stop_codon:yes gene_type:complete
VRFPIYHLNIGLTNQRKNCDEYFRKVSRLNLGKDGSDYYRFSPEKPGSAILFKPTNVLHRGRKPQEGNRYTLTFSMVPLFASCKDWPIERCVDYSLDILEKNYLNENIVDASPYWK